MYSDHAISSRAVHVTKAIHIALALALTSMTPSHAQDAYATDLEEIVVVGIRGSLDRALDVKRNASGFVDAVSAEDVGKLPDGNVAEALQRVTGVAIQRYRGEGDFVSIRGLGPNFVRSVVNGRTMLSATEYRSATLNGGADYSTGREVNFDVLPSEIVRTLEVVKSPSAEHAEGGIGGVVNVHTQRPMALGNVLVGGIQGTYRAFNEEMDPSGSVLLSRSNDDFGWLASLSYSSRSIREDNNNSYGYCSPATGWCAGPLIDTDGDGAGDLQASAIMSANLPEVFQVERERVTAQGTVQWQAGDAHEWILDALHSERIVDNLGTIASTDCCGPSGPVGGEANPDGSMSYSAAVNGNGTLIQFPLGSNVAAITDEQDIDDSLLSLGLNHRYTSGEFGLDSDLSFSQADGYLNFQRVSITTLAQSPFDVSQDDQVGISLLPGGPDLTDLANYRTNNADSIERYNDDREFALGTGAWYGDSWKLGFRYRERTKEVEDRTTFNANTDKFATAGSGIATFQVSNFLNGSSPFPYDQIPFPVVASQRAFVRAMNPDANFDSVYVPSASYEITEQTAGAYVQFDFERTLGDLPYTGNVGVRVVQTDTEATGFFQPFRIDHEELDEDGNRLADPLGKLVTLSDDISQEELTGTYTNVLPSLNLRLELDDDLYLRFAANQSLTRPTFKQMSPGLTVNNPTNRIGTAGNPSLVAYEATNLDLGLEWYFGSGSAVYLGAFWKDIDEFIGSAVTTSPATDDSDGDGDGIPDGRASGVERFGVGFASISEPLNQGNANITGVEVGYQHALDNGLGWIANVTLVDSEAEFITGAKAGEEIPFEGVSDYSYNLTGYYEQGAWQARAAWSYRSDFVVLSSDVFSNTVYADAYGQLDASLSYALGDSYRLFFSGLNLTDAEPKLYSDTVDRPVSLAHVGARLEFGMRATF